MSSSAPSIESRTCSAYDIPIESRTCSAYDIPIESRTCSAYDIAIEKEKSDGTIPSLNDTPQKPTTTEDDNASSVIDKSEISSRGINKDGITRDQVHEEILSFIDAPLTLPREQRSFLTIVMFLTRLPVPTTTDLHPGFLMKGMCYFPVVGLLIGLAVATTFDLIAETFQLPPSISAVVSVGTGWVITGCFHEDGLSDSVDGIGGGWTRAQIFKIMTDSRVGTYGCAALGLYTIAKVQLLALLGTSHWRIPVERAGLWSLSQGAGPAMMVAQSLARVTSPYLIRRFDYVDDEQGPKSSFYAFMIQAKHLVNWPRATFAIVFGGVAVAVIYNPWVALVLVTVVLAFAHAAGRFGNRILGGVMGDFLGATICLTELLILAFLLMVQTQQQQGEDGWWERSWSHLWAEFSTLDVTILLGRVYSTMRELGYDSALVRFLFVWGFKKAWTTYVKGPTTDEDESAPSSTVSNGSEIQNAKSTSSANGKETTQEDTPKGNAACILAIPTSTFQERYDAVQAYLDTLAKPVGSLGTLEAWAARLSALQRTLQPNADNVACLIFAGDHGVAAAPEEGGEGCSAYPQAVTRSVLLGLHRGVAGASVLAKANNVSLRVVDVGVILGNDNPFPNSKYVVSSPQKLTKGTRNFCLEPALSVEECQQCMTIGRDSLIEYGHETASRVVVLGEVGIGNTTSASALVAALTKKPTNEVCGAGAFLTREVSEAVIAKKITIVDKALAKHFSPNRNQSDSIQAADALAKLGGTEIAAMVGALLEASRQDIAVLVDGFIATAAALVAVAIAPDVCHVLFFASHSVEPGQRAAIDRILAIADENQIPIDGNPALSMNLRMGEATAALLAVPILRCSAKVLADMATIQDILG